MEPTASWLLPPDGISLPEDEVHVWRARLDVAEADLRKMSETLAPEERERAGRFRFPKDRRHFTAARGVLRDILARYCGRDSADLQFAYNHAGKPSLKQDSESGGLRFNVSHSHGLALYAVAPHREVGIDLELVQARLAEERIAERFFSPAEVSRLRALPPGLQVEAFFNCWTSKEAYIKARGEGLAIPLDSFDVSLDPAEPAALLADRNNPSASARWRIQELSPGLGYVAALAAEGHGWKLRLWEWAGLRAA